MISMHKVYKYAYYHVRDKMVKLSYTQPFSKEDEAKYNRYKREAEELRKLYIDFLYNEKHRG